jgi:hypothetical protein
LSRTADIDGGDDSADNSGDVSGDRVLTADDFSIPAAPSSVIDPNC